MFRASFVSLIPGIILLVWEAHCVKEEEFLTTREKWLDLACLLAPKFSLPFVRWGFSIMSMMGSLGIQIPLV